MSDKPDTVRRRTAHSPFDEVLGEKIFLLRDARGVSQQRLAELTGIDKSTLGFIELGRVRCSVQRFITICDALSMKAADVIDTL